MNFTRLDLRFSDALSQIFFLVPSNNYDMIGKEGRLVIRTDQGVELFNATGDAAGVTVVDHLLTDYLQYEDGSKVAPGYTVAAYRVAPILAGIVDADPLHKKTKRYWYGFTSDSGGDEWAVEGFWDIDPDAGPIDRCSSGVNYSVQVGGAANVSVFFPGTQGVPRPSPSGSSGTEAYIIKTTSYTISNADPKYIYGDTDGGVFTLTLPTSPTDGVPFSIKNTGTSSNDLTVARNGKTIDDDVIDLTIQDNESRKLQYTTDGWKII